MKPLPENHEPYIDKYFLRSKAILEADNLNPFVRAQIFIRKGPGTIHGLDEAVAIIDKYSDLEKNGGRVYSLREGAAYDPKETLMVVEGRIQDIITLETMYLGVISAETTLANDKQDVDLEKITENMYQVIGAARGKPVFYFGARHWRYDRDAEIARAAYEGGATSASTDIGAGTFGENGIGTIPHALEAVYAWKHGYEHAVVEATKAFDRHIDRNVPRVALIDFGNKEITDSLATATALRDILYAVRVDTGGENIPEGAVPIQNHEGQRYWDGKGVTVAGVYALRTALNGAGRDDVKIILSSGFGNVEKVKAFTDAEDELGLKLYDGLGVGSVYHSRMATMDIVGVGDTLDTIKPLAKVGRAYNPNKRLELVGGM